MRSKTSENDNNQRFVDTGERPQNFIQGTAYHEQLKECAGRPAVLERRLRWGRTERGPAVRLRHRAVRDEGTRSKRG